MGQSGVPTSKETIDKIVRLRDEQGLEWTVIATRFSISPTTAKNVYDRRKAGLDAADEDEDC